MAKAEQADGVTGTAFAQTARKAGQTLVALASLGLTVGIMPADLLAAETDESKTPVLEALTRAYEEMPRSFHRLAPMLRSGVLEDIAPTPRILYREVAARITERAIGVLRAMPWPDNKEPAPDLDSIATTIRDKLLFNQALNLIENSAQAYFDLKNAGGRLSVCDSPQFKPYRGKHQLALCVHSQSGRSVSVRTLVGGQQLNDSVFRIEGGRYALVDVLTAIDERFVTF